MQIMLTIGKMVMFVCVAKFLTFSIGLLMFDLITFA